MVTKKNKYDNKEQCVECGGENHLGKIVTDGGYVSECECTCIKCGLQVYWSYGFFNIEPPESEMHLHTHLPNIPEIPKVKKQPN